MPRMMQTNSCKGTVYVVKEKDSLYKIAKAHGVRVKDIMRQNPFVNVYNLQIGDELCVPGFTNVIEGAFNPYVVKKGETILDIAKMHITKYADNDQYYDTDAVEFIVFQYIFHKAEE